MRSLLQAIGVCMLIAVPTAAQTVNDVEQNFYRTGKPGEWTGQGLNLSIKFDEAGQLCEAVWPAEQYVDNIFQVGPSRVPADQIKTILNLLAPRELRGEPVGPLWGMGDTGGGMGNSEYVYQNLTVTGFYSFRANAEALPDSKPSTFGSTPLSEEPPAVDVAKETELNFFERRKLNEEFHSASVVLIRWKNRCGQSSN